MNTPSLAALPLPQVGLLHSALFSAAETAPPLALAGRSGGGVSGREATSLNMSPAGTDRLSSSGSDGSYTVEALLSSRYTFSAGCRLLFMRLS